MLTSPIEQIWNLFEGGNLFRPIKNGHLDDELHFAQMISLMGPPPKRFLERSHQCSKYWDTEGKSCPERIILLFFIPLTILGNWIAPTPIPEQTLEIREMRLKGRDRDLLLALIRKILRWLPEDRPSAQDLFEDEFIVQFMAEVDLLLDGYWQPFQLSSRSSKTHEATSTTRRWNRNAMAKPLVIKSDSTPYIKF